ncbi:MAG: pyridoxal phosphate-dependent aminotransferase [Oligoflexia bacterium]|nr:pyridoxal phosphate-dependent aminotransferase [Oligoflexia bacterium]
MGVKKTMATFADRMQHIESSGIRRLFELGSQLSDPIDLSLGQPDFEPPVEVQEWAIAAIREGRNRYSPTAGIPELRAALANKLHGEGIATAESVMVTAGASGGLLLALMALADANTDVYVPDPYFVAYPQLIRLAGARMIPIDTYPDFHLTPERLARAVAKADPKRRRLLIFNSPNNPTGVAYEALEIRRLAETARELGFQVISDEVYDVFTYETPHVSWLRTDPTAVLVRAFSKTGGMPGWRIGYAAAPPLVLEQMLKLQQFTFVCVNTVAQWACLKLLETDLTDRICDYRARRDFLRDQLSPRFGLIPPSGTFFAFPSCPADPERFLRKCLEKQLLVVPGNVFSARNTNFRISFSAKPGPLGRGIGILNQIAEELQEE